MPVIKPSVKSFLGHLVNWLIFYEQEVITRSATGSSNTMHSCSSVQFRKFLNLQVATSGVEHQAIYKIYKFIILIIIIIINL